MYLDTNTLANGRVRLFGLDTDFLEDDALGVGSTSEGVGLEGSAQVGLLVSEIGPALVTSTVSHLTRASNSTWLTHVEGWSESKSQSKFDFLKFNLLQLFPTFLLRQIKITKKRSLSWIFDI